MRENKKTVVRCRAIIVQNDKLLIVKHSEDSDFYALPGGHLEWGEDIRDSLKREIIEELGAEPQIGRLLYVNNLIKEVINQNIEFFFEVTNPHDYLEVKNLGGTHKHELVEICWLKKDDARKLLPKQVQTDLNNGTILSDTVRFL